MKKVFLKYNFMLFLYAYLRQIDLSIDRNPGTPWRGFIAYYKRQIDPGSVADLLLNAADITSQEVYIVDKDQIKRTTKSMKFINVINRGILGRHYLTMNEIMYAYQQLKRFEKYLGKNFDRQEQELLRQDIGRIAYGVLQYKLKTLDRLDAEGIECYEVSEHVAPVPMSRFSKNII